MGFYDKWMLPGYIKRVLVPEMFSRMHRKIETRKNMDKLSSRLGKHLDMKKLRKKFLSSLLRDTESIKLGDSGTHWSDYYDQTEQSVLQNKLKSVAKLFGVFA